MESKASILPVIRPVIIIFIRPQKNILLVKKYFLHPHPFPPPFEGEG
jgi:hypothetical protein